MSGGHSGIEELLGILWRRKWWLVATLALVLSAAAVITAQLPKVYSTQSYLLVQPDRPAASDYEATQIATTLITTYSELLDTRNVAIAVENELPDRLHDEIDRVSIEPIQESQLIAIRARANTPADAQEVANTFARVFVGIASRFTGAGVASGKVSVAVTAAQPQTQTAPRPKLYLALALLLGSILGAGVALLRNRFDQRLDVTASTTELFGLPVIARIPHRSGAAEAIAAGDTRDTDARVLAEAFRLLLANLSFANLGERPSTIAVLSSSASEGKSLTALALGRAAAELGIETLLVDADLRRPGLTQRLGDQVAPAAAGLSSFLVRSALSLTEASSELPQSKLSVVPAGPIPPNPAALLGSKALPEFDRRAQRAYEFVVYDTPPLSIAADAPLIASITEGAILVVDVRNARRRVVMQAVDQLKRSPANVLGVVLNRVQESQNDYYGYGAGYGPGAAYDVDDAPETAPSGSPA